jgi:hypothetical protein
MKMRVWGVLCFVEREYFTGITEGVGASIPVAVKNSAARNLNSISLSKRYVHRNKKIKQK